MKRLLTKAEVAELLGVSERPLEMWHAAGADLGRIRLGGRVRYRSEAVERLLDTGVTVPRRRQPRGRLPKS